MSLFFTPPQNEKAERPSSSKMTQDESPPIVATVPTFLKDISEESLSTVTEYLKQQAEKTPVANLSLTGLGPWSPSKVKSLQKCPFQFYLKYVQKSKLPANLIFQEDPTSAHVGTALHEVLELVMIGKELGPSFAKVHRKFVPTGLMPEEVWQDRVFALAYHITKFKDRMDSFGLRNKIKKVFTELRIAVTREYEPTGFFSDNAWLRGVIDLIIVLENGDILIIDHKTGGGFGGIRAYEDQLDWYKVLYHYGIEHVSGAQAGVHFIGIGDIKMGSFTPVLDIENKVKNNIEMTIEGAIEFVLQTGFFKHVRGSYCKWCEYDNLGCKSGALKETEKKTSRVIPIVELTSSPA